MDTNPLVALLSQQILILSEVPKELVIRHGASIDYYADIRRELGIWYSQIADVYVTMKLIEDAKLDDVEDLPFVDEVCCILIRHLDSYVRGVTAMQHTSLSGN
jgi:hypothetical protein